MTTYVHDHSNIDVVRHVNVIDGEVRPQPYTSAGRKYRVERAVIKYYYSSGDWRLSGAVLLGTVLKKDGTDSKNDAREQVSHFDTPPMWLSNLVDGIRPQGGPTLPFNVTQSPDGV